MNTSIGGRYGMAISLSICLVMLFCFSGMAQGPADTLKFSLQQAEQRFIEKNLPLLAGHLGVEADKALIEQARLWDNPVLITDQNIYAAGRFMSHGKTVNGQPNGQIFVQVQQLIKTAGKRGKLIELATTNAQLSALQLQDVMRSLRYELRTGYYSIIRLRAIHNILSEQANQLHQLLKGMEAQLKAGNIANKDYLRIQAVMISLQQDLTGNQVDLSNAEAGLKTLLQLHPETIVMPTDTLQATRKPELSLAQLVQNAKANNPFYLAQQKQVIYQQQNLVYQKALRAPDLTIAPEYDKASNYTTNYVGLSISLPLPLFNKNQGNIRSAAFTVKQHETQLQQAEINLENEVANTYKKLVFAIEQNGTLQQDFYQNYKAQFSNIVKSFQQRQISMLEFIDFFNDYKEVNLRLLQQQLQLQLAKEELNYTIGTTLVP